MQGSSVKLTLRLPQTMHERLRKRALESRRSLNTVIVETLQNGMLQTIDVGAQDQEERFWQALQENGLWEPLGMEWQPEIDQAPKISHAELQKEMQGVPSLSDLIIEERGSRP
jgi:hypothetical protein